jgi:Tol biopolymer transport system component
VAFSSLASDLVPGDGNDVQDVFVHDRQTGTTVRASVDSAGVEGNGRSYFPTISADGRFIAFESSATNFLSPPASSTAPQVYVHDMTTGQTVLGSVNGFGAPVPSSYGHAISADGRFLAFHANGSHILPGDSVFIGDGIYVRDLSLSVTTRVSVNSQGVAARTIAGGNRSPSISGDGRFVAFQSPAGNLAPGDDNDDLDVFVHDRLTATTVLASVSGTGELGNAMSGVPKISVDGRFVAFSSRASNLVPDDRNARDDTFVHDFLTGSTTRVSVRTDGLEGSWPGYGPFPTTVADAISVDGRFVAFSSRHSNLVPGDTNGYEDVFIHDRAAPRPNAYCEGKTDSQGCLPSMSSAGLPAVSGSSAFDVRAIPVQSGRLGVLWYSLGPDREPYLGGRLCIARPLRRAVLAASGGNAAAHDCTGSLTFDFNVRIRSGIDADLVPGTVVYAQYFYRDPTDPAGSGTGASDALRFAIQP